MSQRFPVRKLFALSWAVYRQNGYELVRANRRSSRISSAKQLRQMIHRSHEDRGIIAEDWDRADEMIDMAKGLVLKSMERADVHRGYPRDRGPAGNLSALESGLVQIIKEEYVAIDNQVVNCATAVPEMLQTQQMNDRWYKMERSLTGSTHIGNPESYGEMVIHVVPQYTQRVRNGFYGASTFVAGVTLDGNVVKFYLYDSESSKIQIGKEVVIRGRVKRHDVNRDGIRQTFLRQVYLSKDQSSPW